MTTSSGETGETSFERIIGAGDGGGVLDVVHRAGRGLALWLAAPASDAGALARPADLLGVLLIRCCG